jgi:glucose/arabinose dehydrogenase
VISEFRARSGSDEADAGSERVLLTVRQPYPNHNGGDIHFGPDGKLYIGLGDGGSGDDPHGNGQNPGSLLGKMLRIDVDRPDPGKAYGVPPDNPFTGRAGAAPEVWALGLRNPWRFSFDPATGRLYAGDVGQSAREEIDLIEKGRNYGWNIMEGTICTPGVNPDCDTAGLEKPILDYPRSEGTTVIGGRVYRGRSIPGLCGVYLYADYGSGRVWGLRYDGKTAAGLGTLIESGRPVSSFGEDGERELYLVDYRGEILKIAPAPTAR